MKVHVTQALGALDRFRVYDALRRDSHRSPDEEQRYQVMRAQYEVPEMTLEGSEKGVGP